MLLHELLHRYDPRMNLAGIPNTAVSGLSDDSRTCKPGDLFLAREGVKNNGSNFIKEAVLHGAVAIVSPVVLPDVSIPQIKIADPAAVSKIANQFYGDPSKQLKVIGVTGTNGKTTTTFLIRQILVSLGVKCGVIGTVEIDDGENRVEANLTTPGALDVARILSDMVKNGCAACAIETSSHALHQQRAAGVTFAAAGFTNLSGDHLDYHKTIDDYASAKAELFNMLPPDAVACVNAADEYSPRITRNCAAATMLWGFKTEADYRADDMQIDATGSSFTLITPSGKANFSMKMIGKHNIENALCAAALCGQTFGATAQQLADGLTGATGAPGRLQPVVAGQPFAVLVDYAHTDDALKNVLSALKPLTRGKLRVVFGCGGDRDRTKRPRMAKIAEDYADAIYVTSDNPRTESAVAVIDEILTGFNIKTNKAITVEPDRKRAIELALGDAQPEDVVLLAGKGHESYQIIGTTKHHFDDVEQCQKMLSTMKLAVA